MQNRFTPLRLNPHNSAAVSGYQDLHSLHVPHAPMKRHDKSYAALCGPTVKAANTRQAMPFLKVIADRYLTNPLDMDHVLIHQLIRHTLEFNRLVYSSGTVFTAGEIIAFKTATEGIGKFMQLLRSRAKQAKHLLWHIVPKTHYMQHLLFFLLDFTTQKLSIKLNHSKYTFSLSRAYLSAAASKLSAIVSRQVVRPM